ncbi:putative reverse transcriptase domain-containing protein [Tanacetum coccineum]|uniref:Reverse transcriptase domain-containing protein n=1 Tax=Tanacetum coccineum TaxID=301880 RepID=A0ABQ5A139_9ASTR
MGLSIKNFDGASLANGFSYYCRKYFHDKPIKINESYMIWLHYTSDTWEEWKEAKNFVTFCFLENENIEVKECGARVVSDEDLEQDIINVFDRLSLLGYGSRLARIRYEYVSLLGAHALRHEDPLLEEYYNPAHGHAEDNKNDQAPNASFQEAKFINPFCTRVQEIAESSSRNIDNTVVHLFQPQSHDFRWTRDHPLEQVRGNPTMPVQTRRQLATNPEMCMFALTVSIVEPNKIKEAMADSAWIEAMQDELHQFDKLKVYNCKPHTFKGTEGVVGLKRWFEKIEQVFEICKCAEDDKVKFAMCTFEGRALTWWNGNVQTLGLANANQIPWSNVKAMMTTEYCPATEIEKMEQELWTLTLKGDDIEAYSNRFHELVLMCPELMPTESKKIGKYIRGFPEGIKGNMISSRPATLHEAINMARALVEQSVQGKAARISESNKRKWEDNQRNTNNNNHNYNNNHNNNQNRNRNNNYPQQQNRRQEPVRAYAAAPAGGRIYAGNLPKCNRCNLHHHGPCPQRCQKCQKLGHQEKDCRFGVQGAGNNFLQNMTCFGCGEKGHLKDKCPKARNQQNDGARARSYVVVKIPGRIRMWSGIGLAYYRLSSIVMRRLSGFLSEWRDSLKFKARGGNSLDHCMYKADEKSLMTSELVRDFPEVFPRYLLGLPHWREVEFPHRSNSQAHQPVVRSPYRTKILEAQSEASKDLKAPADG